MCLCIFDEGGEAVPAATDVHVPLGNERSPEKGDLVTRVVFLGIDELVDGEEGVSPGQACVFYDAPAGQARVLGGGFISAAPRDLVSVPRQREALAG